MAVVSSVQLPSQPAVGAVVLEPLGGNGFDSPHSLYRINITLTSDASGGSSDIYVRFDTRYTQVVGSAILNVSSGPGTIEGNLQILVGSAFVAQARASMLLSAAGALGTTNSMHWTPEPYAIVADANSSALAVPHLRSTIDNVDTEAHFLYAVIYNFDRSARHRVPLTRLFSFLTRPPYLSAS